MALPAAASLAVACERASALCRIRHAAQAQHVALLGTCRTIPRVHEIALAGRNNRPTQESRRDQWGEAGQGQTTKGFWLGGGKEEAKTQMQLCPAFICFFCFSFVLSVFSGFSSVPLFVFLVPTTEYLDGKALGCYRKSQTQP